MKGEKGAGKEEVVTSPPSSGRTSRPPVRLLRDSGCPRLGEGRNFGQEFPELEPLEADGTRGTGVEGMEFLDGFGRVLEVTSGFPCVILGLVIT